MTNLRWFGTAVVAGLAGTLIACSQQPAANNPTAPNTRSVLSAENSIPQGLFTSDDKLMVDGKAMTFGELRNKLPTRISAADAEKVLVHIDANKVVDKANYSVQWYGGYRGYGRGYGYGLYGGFRNYYSSAFYYPYSSYYFPYYYNAGYYYPYSYYNYASPLSYAYTYPYMYLANSYYYPYYYRWW